MERRSAIARFKEQLRLERNYSEHTVKAYLSDVEKFFRHLGEDHPERIGTEQIRGFIQELREMGVSVPTQARTLSSVKAFFRFLLQEELIGSDPSALIEMPRTERRSPDVLSPEEIKRVIEGIDLSAPLAYRNKAMIELLYGCGLRVSELTELRISELHFDEGYVRIRGKGGKERLVPLGRTTQKAVREYLDQDRMQQKAVDRFEDVLFLNRKGKALSRVMIFNIVRRTAQEAGIEKRVSPHTYRHSFATHLVEGGADLMAVREMLGHASVTTTEIYSHLDREYLQQELVHHHPRSERFRKKGGT
ncbi:MAG: site-specific tyrosine recombinase XerD [Flavobacteriales bacterium]